MTGIDSVTASRSRVPSTAANATRAMLETSRLDAIEKTRPFVLTANDAMLMPNA